MTNKQAHRQKDAAVQSHSSEPYMPLRLWTVAPESRTATVRNHLGGPIARCYRGDPDARLIAALPALLNVLHDAGDVIEAQLAHGEVSEAGWQLQLGEIVAAISLPKATRVKTSSRKPTPRTEEKSAGRQGRRGGDGEAGLRTRARGQRKRSSMSRTFNTPLTPATKDEWLTPPDIIRALGEFDLDSCAPVRRPWDMAKSHYSTLDNGMTKPWFGRVWLNPSYGYETFRWIARGAAHGKQPQCPTSPTLTLSTGKIIPTRWVGEQHVREDLGRIPSAADWLREIRPQRWMGRSQRFLRTSQTQP